MNPHLPVGRRTALGAAAWSAPVIAVAAAAPAYAASGPATALQRLDPTATSFSVGTASRTVRTRLVNGTTPVVGAVVVFTLSDATFVTFPDGSTSTTGITDATGVASATLVPATGANPGVGSAVTLTATYQALSVVWTVTYGRFDTIASGSSTYTYHALGLSGGRAYAWGSNDFGQLGDGISNGSTTPVAVATAGTPMAGRTIVAVAAGESHSVALDAEGNVYAWGSNTFGELGDGTTDSPRTVPVAVATAGTPMAGRTITSIAAGTSHSVALDAQGNVYTWGGNYSSQLGDGTTSNSTTPVAVATIGTPMAAKTIVAVAAGAFHSVALDAQGNVYTWGSNGNGQLGDGTTDSPRTVPVAVANTGTPMAGRTITSIAAGESHSVALDAQGNVYTWGSNGNGQLGDGTTNSPRTVPVAVANAGTPMAAKTITAIAAGAYDTYAVSTDQLGFSWGFGDLGGLGNGGTASSSVPTQVAGVPASTAARVTRSAPPRVVQPAGAPAQRPPR